MVVQCHQEERSRSSVTPDRCILRSVSNARVQLPLRGTHLVAVLASPPLSTSGERTIARVNMAAACLGSASASISNLLKVATDDVRQISVAGASQDPWIASRQELETSIAAADTLLFAWGCSEPTGAAREHHRAQVAWLMGTIRARGLSYWTVDDKPRHPSRWQRHTWRAHPGVPFQVALKASLVEH